MACSWLGRQNLVVIVVRFQDIDQRSYTAQGLGDSADCLHAGRQDGWLQSPPFLNPQWLPSGLSPVSEPDRHRVDFGQDLMPVEACHDEIEQYRVGTLAPHLIQPLFPAVGPPDVVFASVGLECSRDRLHRAALIVDDQHILSEPRRRSSSSNCAGVIGLCKHAATPSSPCRPCPAG